MKKQIDTFRISCGTEPITIKPLGDIHFGSRNCDVTALKRYLGEPNDRTYIIGLGDWHDSIIASDRKRYRRSADGTEPYSDDIVDSQVNGLYEIMEPYKEQIIGLGTGNHEDVITKICGTNPSKRLASLLDVPYLGYSWLYKLQLRRDDSGGGRTVIIRGHHGFGGGSRTQGSDLTKYAKDMAYFDADIFMYGHVHKLQYDAIERLGVVGERLVAKPHHLCICGTFLKTYSDNTDVTYSEEKGFPPTSLGGLDINLRINPKKWCDIDVNIRRI